MTMGSGRHPPSEVYSEMCDSRVAMQMRLPVHVWAMLSRGREAEAAETTQDVNWGARVEGVRGRKRWREWDGERHDARGRPCPSEWIEFHIQRMEWVNRNGVWCGEWKWQAYDRINEWNATLMRRRPNNTTSQSFTASKAPWQSLPQEVLLGTLREIDRRQLASVGLVCHAWFTVCAPELYCRISVRSVKELLEAISNAAGSRIAQHAESLTIHGSIPCPSLPQLLTLLPRLHALSIHESDETSRITYNPSLLRLSSTILIASRTTFALAKLVSRKQRFSSTADVLRLLACCSQLSSAFFDRCTIATASPTFPLVTSTHLRSVTLSGNAGTVHDDAIASVAQWWRWPQGMTDTESTPAPYPGLHRADARIVFAIMRSVAFHILKWKSVSLSLPDLCRPGSWVLLTTVTSGQYTVDCMQLEFHAVTHIVIRINTIDRSVGDLPYGDVLARMEAFMILMPHLRAVTLEAPDIDALANLATNLARLQANGTLHLRTCREAQQAAEAAKQDTSGRSEVRGVVSPLWHSENESIKHEREHWSAIIAEAERRHKNTAGIS